MEPPACPLTGGRVGIFGGAGGAIPAKAAGPREGKCVGWRSSGAEILAAQITP